MGLFDALANLFTHGSDRDFASQQTEREYNHAYNLNQQNYENQLDMWNRTNDYNHPANQMSRYMEAGLNPNLIYGQSNTASNPNVMSSVQGRAHDPVYRNINFGNVGQQFISMLSSLEDLHSKKRENQIQDAVANDIISSYDLKNEFLSQNIRLADLEFKKGRYDLAAKRMDNVLKQFDISQLSKRAELNDINLAMARNDLNNIPIYNDILNSQSSIFKNQADISTYDSLFKSWDWIYNRPYDYEIKKQTLKNLKSNTEYYDSLSQKTRNDDKWYWRLSGAVTSALSDLATIYLGSKIKVSNPRVPHSVNNRPINYNNGLYNIH